MVGAFVVVAFVVIFSVVGAVVVAAFVVVVVVVVTFSVVGSTGFVLSVPEPVIHLLLWPYPADCSFYRLKYLILN